MSPTAPYTSPSDIYINPSAATYTYTPQHSPNDPPTDPAKIKSFHASLPTFARTPLHDARTLAQRLGVRNVLVKAEAQRLGLPAFKILGASWGVYRALCGDWGLEMDPDVTGFERLREEGGRRRRGRVVLFAATDGNHGRAVARMAGLLLGGDAGVGAGDDEPSSVIYVPAGMYDGTRRLIESEGAKVVTVRGDYDVAVSECWEASRELEFRSGGREKGIMVQDNAFEGYTTVPRWIVDGYSTLLAEVDEQFAELRATNSGYGRQITHVVTPIGVGSLGHAVVKWAKSRSPPIRVIAVEPEMAGCLHASLKAGQSTTIETVDTIMSGMCCGTVSPISWETLRDGVDASVTVGDWDAHETVLELQSLGIEAGPCGAGCLAGLRRCLGDAEVRKALGVDENSVAVVLSTEGAREYPVPERLN